MDYMTGYIFTDHKSLMEYILTHFDVKYVTNSIVGESRFCQYQYGEMTFLPDDRTLIFAEVYWRYGVKISKENVLTYIKIGDFGKARDIVEQIIEKFGGCVKDKKHLILRKDVDRMVANEILKKGFFI